MIRTRLLLASCLWTLACGDDGSAPAGRDDAGQTSVPRGDSGTINGRIDSGTPIQGGLGRNDAGSGHDDGGGATQQGTDAGGTSPPREARFFPAGAWMYQAIDQAAVDKDSPTITKWLKDNGGFGTGQIRIDYSIEVLTADANTPLRTFTQTDDFYTPDCDPAPIPVPTGGVLEGESGYACTGDGDCHLLVVDRFANRLYEMWRADIEGNTFHGGCATVWDMTRVYGPEGRGEQCSSADAAGFPITPLLFTADEVAAGSIDHAIRFILPNARMRSKTYQHPGNHAGGPSGGVNAPIYGSRWRLRANFDLGTLPSAGARVVARALQKYGMALADGGNIALTAQSDRLTTAKWDGLLDSYDLSKLLPTDFEIVETGEPIPLTYDCNRTTVTN